MTTQPTYTAITMRPHLLKVLYELSDGKAGVEIKHEKTYPKIFKEAGITDLESYPQNNNQPTPYRWVQWAFQSICKEKWGERKGKGIWTLTPAGIAICEHPENVLTEGVEETGATEEDDYIPTRTEALSLSVGGGHVDDYHSDPYIRMLAIDQARTPCFGSHALESGVCQNCPAQNSCRNATSLTYLRLANTLLAEDRKAEQDSNRKNAPEVLPVAPASPATQLPPAADAPEDYKGVDFSKARNVTPPIGAICSRCRQGIEENTPAFWVRGPNKSSMFHPPCFEAVKAETGKVGA